MYHVWWAMERKLYWQPNSVWCWKFYFVCQRLISDRLSCASDVDDLEWPSCRSSSPSLTWAPDEVFRRPSVVGFVSKPPGKNVCTLRAKAEQSWIYSYCLQLSRRLSCHIVFPTSPRLGHWLGVNAVIFFFLGGGGASSSQQNRQSAQSNYDKQKKERTFLDSTSGLHWARCCHDNSVWERRTQKLLRSWRSWRKSLGISVRKLRVARGWVIEGCIVPSQEGSQRCSEVFMHGGLFTNWLAWREEHVNSRMKNAFHTSPQYLKHMKEKKNSSLRKRRVHSTVRFSLTFKASCENRGS